MYKYEFFLVCKSIWTIWMFMYYSRCHRKSAGQKWGDLFWWLQNGTGFRILKPDTGCRPKNLIKKPNQMPHHRIHFCHRSKTTVFDLWSSHFCIVLNITWWPPVSSSTCTSLRPHPAWRPRGSNASTWRIWPLHGSAGRLLLKCFYLSI